MGSLPGSRDRTVTQMSLPPTHHGLPASGYLETQARLAFASSIVRLLELPGSLALHYLELQNHIPSLYHWFSTLAKLSPPPRLM